MYRTLRCKNQGPGQGGAWPMPIWMVYPRYGFDRFWKHVESSVKPVAQSTVSSLDRDSSTLERYMDGDMNPGRSLDVKTRRQVVAVGIFANLLGDCLGWYRCGSAALLITYSLIILFTSLAMNRSLVRSWNSEAGLCQRCPENVSILNVFLFIIIIFNYSMYLLRNLQDNYTTYIYLYYITIYIYTYIYIYHIQLYIYISYTIIYMYSPSHR
jgi:hypothetical protein